MYVCTYVHTQNPLKFSSVQFNDVMPDDVEKGGKGKGKWMEITE